MRPRNQTQSVKNYSNAFSQEIASCIWARFTQKNSSPNLVEEEVEKLFHNYEAKLSGQMVKSLGKSIINIYSMGALFSARNNQSGSFKQRPGERSISKLCSSKIYLRIVLQIRFVFSSLMCWNNYEQTLFI